ncbi:MAG: hypothetical protein WBE42_25805, partial [Pseudolabrys sp.]
MTIALNDAMILPFHANPAWIKFSKGDRKVSHLAVGFRSRRLFMACRSRLVRFYQAAVACAVLDGDTMADRDARRRRRLVLLVRFAVFTALFAFLVIPGEAQE